MSGRILREQGVEFLLTDNTTSLSFIYQKNLLSFKSNRKRLPSLSHMLLRLKVLHHLCIPH